MIGRLLCVWTVVLTQHTAFSAPTIVSGCEPGISEITPGKATPVALLYAHGFSACPMEIEPVFEETTQNLGANALKILFAGHGIPGSEGLRSAKFEDWVAGFASGIGTLKRLGAKRAVIATSTGASLALAHLAARPQEADALVLISPNFGVARMDSELLLLPWGLAELVVDWFVGEYREWTPRTEEHGRYWTTKYPSTALIEMMKAVRAARNAPLENIRVPTLVLYCEQDYVLDVGAMKKQVRRIGAPAKMVQAPCTQDTHVLAGKILAPNDSASVRHTIVEFLKGI